MFNLKLFPVFLLIAGTASANDGPLQSPYFIDALHCSGLAQQADSPSSKNLSLVQETDPIQAIELEEHCTDLFKTFGIEPYQWISPVELERLSAQVRESPYFETASLSIKRSELKNHVHIFLKVKTKPKYVYSFGLKTKVYDPNNTRLFNRIYGEMVDRSLQPNAENTWNFALDTGFAANPISGRSRCSDQFYNKNFYVLDVYYNHKKRIGQNLTWSTKTRSIVENIDSQLSAVNFTLSFDADLVYSRYLKFLSGSAFGGVAAIVTPNLRFLQSGLPGDPYDVPFLIPGFKIGYLSGHANETNFRTEFAMYLPISGSSQRVLDWKTALNLNLGRGYAMNTALNLRDCGGLLLARDKAPSTAAMNNNLTFGLTKRFGSDAEYSEISLSTGFEGIAYTLKPFNPTTVSPYVQLGYRYKADTMNLDFSFAYLPQRIY